jgi:hypothetical protein
MSNYPTYPYFDLYDIQCMNLFFNVIISIELGIILIFSVIL